LGIADALGRNICYLRVSVTDRCNFRCTYCMPSAGVEWISHQEILSYEEIERIIRASARLGVYKVRITGGEPLMRKDLLPFIRNVAAIPGISDLAMTTNGSALSENAVKLKEAGLTRVNVSLDTLKPALFKKLTGRDMLAKVLAGIDSSYHAGLTPIKINMVVMKHVNDDELPDFARMTLDKPYQVRFIEHMPFQTAQGKNEKLVPFSGMKDILAAGGFPTLLPESHGDGPAQVFRIPGAKGSLGFVSPVSRHFCEECNRIRLTADGRIKPCLLSNQEYNIKELLRSGCTDQELEEYLIDAIWHKPNQHLLDDETTELRRGMSKIGG